MKLCLEFWKNNRKWILLCLVLVLTGLFGETVQAAVKYGINNGGKGKWAYHVLNEKKKIVEIRPGDLCYVDREDTLKIPNTIKGQDGKTTYKVTKIADYAFYSCMCDACFDYSSVEKRWKKSIGDVGCYCCLDKVVIPANVTQIGKYAFEGVPYWDDDAEVYSYSLTSVTFKGNNLEKIDDGAFSNTELSSITIPASCKTIGEYAFSGSYLKKITFKGDNITSIGSYAFEWTDLESITIPSKIKKIEKGTFYNCSWLSSVTFKGNNITEIAQEAFYETGLTSINIPSKCKTIGESAFKNCNLTSITFLGNQLTTIGNYAFYGNDMVGITLPTSCTNIGTYSFGECDKLKTVTFSQTGNITVDELAFSGSPITKVNIQNYTIYQCLIDRFDYGDYVKVDSQSTRLYIEHNGQTVWVDVPKGEEIDLSAYINVPEGKEIYAGCILYGETMNPDHTQGTYSYTGNRDSMLDNYKAEGYPFAEISTYIEDLHYHVVTKYIAKIKNHSDCDIEEWTDKDSKLGQRNWYYFCYQDQFTLANLDEVSLLASKGYKPVGYSINGKRFQPGSVINGKDLAVSSCQYLSVEVEYLPISYQIAYDFNGGDGSALSNTSCTYDKESTLATNTSFNGGYKFVGWCESPDGEGTIYKNGATVKNLTSTDGEVVTLYAIWKDESLVITFNPNGGTVSQTSKKVRYNQQFGNLPTPKREGYTFKGWTLGPNGGTVVTGASVVQYNCDFNLFAQWEAKKYKITFNANGGTGGGSKEVKYGKSIGSLPKAKKKGYKFKGWYTAKSGGSKITSTTKVTARKTYYAQWEEKAKTITITVKPKNIKKLDGYQVKYGKKGGEMTTKTYASGTKKSITVKITGVKSGETYVAKARSYRKVKGKKKWSKWKTVTKTVK